MMKKLLLSWVLCLPVTLLFAQQSEKTEILLVGFDHLSQLSNGTPESDVFSTKKQQEIKAIVAKLNQFHPDAIFVEYEPKEQQKLDSLYQLYQSGKVKLSDIEYGASETYQVGFRLAKVNKLKGVLGIDHYESTSQSLLNNGKNFELFKKELMKLMQTARPLKKQVQQDSLSIYEYIKIMNKPEMIQMTHRLLFNLPAYVVNGKFSESGTNTVDIGSIDENYIGAEYITLFYNRNLKIYSNILNTQLEYKPKRIILIMGQLHIGVLQDLLEENPNYSIINTLEYLD